MIYYLYIIFSLNQFLKNVTLLLLQLLLLLFTYKSILII